MWEQAGMRQISRTWLIGRISARLEIAARGLGLALESTRPPNGLGSFVWTGQKDAEYAEGYGAGPTDSVSAR